MKATKITYWVSTGIVSAMMLFSCYAYLTQGAVKEGFHHLGFPDYFRVELGIAKGVGAILLIVPPGAGVSRLKEWVYAGFSITFVSAFIAHSASGDPVSNRIMPLVFMAILLVSYLTYNKKMAVKS
jgi:hypothetical protein